MDHVDTVAQRVADRYRQAYRGEVQGCCLLVVDEILSVLGGEAVAGYLTWYGGSCRRSHWWVEREGRIIDPLGDEFLSTEEATGRHEAHRDQAVFRTVLPTFERWRV